MMTRRHFFERTSAGLGIAALASLFERDLRAEGGMPGLPHFPPTAKRVIYLFQSGAPSQMELFDHKPKLKDLRATELPESIRQGQRLTAMTAAQTSFPVAPSLFSFAQHGASGAWVSELMPHTAKMVDQLCFIKSMHTGAVNHAPAITFFLTGAEQPGRPSMGSWLTYGLGSTSENLPAFVVMTSRDKEASCGQIFYDFYWGSGFLPSKYQGVKFRGSGDPVLYLSNPDGMSRDVRRESLELDERR